jgi:glycosyltransferase involved in cell wall biosynthesis
VISVCLASHNGARFIGAQVESILASPHVTELLVSDDGSTDETLRVLQAVRDPRLRLLAGPRCGVIRNFEFVLGQASGDYIFLSDQDDIWLAQKVERMAEALRDSDLVISDCSVVDEQLRVIAPSFFEARGSGPGVMKNLWRNSYLGCCMAFRRQVLDYVLPFPASVPMHDWWIGLMVNLRGRVRFVNEVLVRYRRHGDNATYAVISQAPILQQLRWRLGMLGALLTRV